MTGRACVLLVVWAAAAGAAEPGAPWDVAALRRAPQVWEAPERATNGVRALFYAGVPYRGQPTRVFAYVAQPTNAPAGAKSPGIVLVHGGGGSAFFQWAQLWAGRGYAAIAMDTCGAVSGQGYNNHARHAHGGPAGWGAFETVDEAPEDQWAYHAVSTVLLGHSLLRALEGVDPARVGVTGISWGGYLTCLAASLDDRFAFAVPVYGCGFLGDNSAWLGSFKGLGEARAKKWLSLWDPSVYLPRAKMPFLWVTGSNDFAYPMDSLQKSYRALRAPYALCVRVGMKHGHGGPGESPEEIRAFADHVVRGGRPLPAVTAVSREGRRVTVRFSSNGRAVARAELNVTADAGAWKERKWEQLPVPLDGGAGELKAEVPAAAKVYYLNLFTDDGLAVSTPHEEL